MSLPLVLSGLAMGLLSSFHCVGMCGAIAFSLPIQHANRTQKVVSISLYNAGRIITYTILGTLFGIAGRQLYVGGLQQWFSVIAGVLIVAMVLQSMFGARVVHLPGFSIVNKWVQKIMGTLLSNPRPLGLLSLGMANGLLPCGLIYLAITAALAAGTISGAALFMAAFGAGTVPAMFLLSYLGFSIKLSVRNTMKKAVPYFVGLVGVLLIIRGLGLNIPYLRPLLGGFSPTVTPCH